MKRWHIPLVLALIVVASIVLYYGATDLIDAARPSLDAGD